MIDDKQIEEKANHYAKENSMSIEDQMGNTYDGIEELSNAYKAGAHLIIEQLLNLWHHKSEVPNGKILYIDDFNFPYGMEWFRDIHYDEDWDAVIDVEHIKGWIYVKDLLPMMKKCFD